MKWQQLPNGWVKNKPITAMKYWYLWYEIFYWLPYAHCVCAAKKYELLLLLWDLYHLYIYLKKCVWSLWCNSVINIFNVQIFVYYQYISSNKVIVYLTDFCVL